MESCTYCDSTTWGAKNDTFCTDCERKWYREEYPQIQADMIMSEYNHNLDLIKGNNNDHIHNKQ